MFEDKRDERYNELVKKSMRHFKALDVAQKAGVVKNLSGALQKATLAAVDEVMKGLQADVREVILNSPEDVDNQVSESFRVAGVSVGKLLQIRAVKGGSAHWLTYAVAGLERPDSKTILATKRTDDEVPIWLRERE